MENALSLAKLAVGQVSPNPAVGAVIVKNGVIIGQGFTQPPGSPHAEIVALAQAGDEARGAALYVTLEPCCHYGRTPPCTQAIIAAGISEVHFAMVDPNPLVSGKGKAELIENGIKVYMGERETAARKLNEAYTKYITTSIPFITAKFAISLDGKIATRTGDSRWISCEESRNYVHVLRYESDAVMAGINTVLADNPRFTSRCCGGRGGIVKKQPLRVIVDSYARMPLNAQMLQEPGKTLLVCDITVPKNKKRALARAGAEILEVPAENGRINLENLFQVLGKRGITSILVEGGGTVLGSLFDRKLVDKVVVFIAPLIIGGIDAKVAVGGTGIEKLADALRLRDVTVQQIGDDVMMIGYIKE